MNTKTQALDRRDAAVNQAVGRMILATAAYRVPVLPPAPVARPCLLPGCGALTTHRGGYCSRAHAEAHRRRSLSEVRA